MTIRHSWGDPVRPERQTDRTCGRCGMVKLTVHEQIIWTEFHRDGQKIDHDRTPLCDARLEWATGEWK